MSDKGIGTEIRIQLDASQIERLKEVVLYNLPLCTAFSRACGVDPENLDQLLQDMDAREFLAVFKSLESELRQGETGQEETVHSEPACTSEVTAGFVKVGETKTATRFVIRINEVQKRVMFIVFKVLERGKYLPDLIREIPPGKLDSAPITVQKGRGLVLEIVPSSNVDEGYGEIPCYRAAT